MNCAEERSLANRTRPSHILDRQSASPPGIGSIRSKWIMSFLLTMVDNDVEKTSSQNHPYRESFQAVYSTLYSMSEQVSFRDSESSEEG